MQLGRDATMIRIRGKRKRCPESDRSHVRRAPGRPLQKSFQSRSAQRSKMLLKLEEYHSRQLRRTSEEERELSALEQLPVELIQQIFFHSLEVNMPRASNHLKRVLSTEGIFAALILFAYFDDDGASPVETKRFLPGEYRILSSLDKIRLQEGILSCRWCTYERVASCLPVLSRLTMVQAWHREDLLDGSHGQSSTMHGATWIVANEAIRELASLPSLDDKAKLERHFLARIGLEGPGNSESVPQNQGRDAYLPRIVTWRSLVDKDGRVYKCIDKLISVLATRHIPSWLLSHGSLIGDRLALLQLLRQGYTFVQDGHIMTISAKAMFDGMRAAIQESNAVGLETLLELHNVLFKSGMQTSSLTPSTYHPLPLDLFHKAARQGTDSSSLLSLLVRAGVDALPRDDEIMTAWAVHEAQRGDALAEWLLKHMDGSADYGLPRRGHLFVGGRLSWRARARSHLPFPETSFATELGYLAGTPVVPVGLHGEPCGMDEVT